MSASVSWCINPSYCSQYTGNVSYAIKTLMFLKLIQYCRCEIVPFCNLHSNSIPVCKCRRWSSDACVMPLKTTYHLAIMINKWTKYFDCQLLHFVWGTAEAKCILVTSVCLSINVFPHYSTDPDVTGWPQIGEKMPRCFQSHNYSFGEVITTETIRNNDLHIWRVIPYQLLLMWLTRGCRPILLRATVSCTRYTWRHMDCWTQAASRV